MSRTSLRSGAGVLCRRVLIRFPVVAIVLALAAAFLPLSQASATSFELYPFAGYMLFSNDFHPNLKDHLGFGGKVGDTIGYDHQTPGIGVGGLHVGFGARRGSHTHLHTDEVR